MQYCTKSIPQHVVFGFGECMEVDMGNVGRRTIDCVTFNSVVTIIMKGVICVSNFSKHARVITIIILSRRLSKRSRPVLLHDCIMKGLATTDLKSVFVHVLFCFKTHAQEFPLELRTGAWRQQN